MVSNPRAYPNRFQRLIRAQLPHHRDILPLRALLLRLPSFCASTRSAFATTSPLPAAGGAALSRPPAARLCLLLAGEQSVLLIQGAHLVRRQIGLVPQGAVRYAQRENVALAASAGNNNTSNPQYPAAYSGVATTAATDIQDVKASFSNYGKPVYVDAPGVNIISAFPGNLYAVVNGTSFSAPTIAGTAALLRSQESTGVVSRVAAGAINIDVKNPNYANQLGYGRIDILKSVTSK